MYARTATQPTRGCTLGTLRTNSVTVHIYAADGARSGDERRFMRQLKIETVTGCVSNYESIEP